MSSKSVVKKYLAAFFSGGPDLKAVHALLTKDFTFQGPLMTASSADDFIEQLKGMGPGMEMHADILHVIDKSDCVAALYDFMGPEGKISFSEWYWIRDDKISAIKLHYDPRPLLEAMGMGQ